MKQTIKSIEEKIVEVKGDMMELYRTCPHSGRRKADSLLKGFLHGIEEENMTREEYYNALLQKKEELQETMHLVNHTANITSCYSMHDIVAKKVKKDNEVVLQIKREIENIFQDLCKNDEMAEDCAIVYLYGLKLFAGGLSQEMYYSMLGELRDELLVMRKMVLKFEQLKEEAIENINYYKNKSEFVDNSKKALEKMLRTLITQQ